jgi:hypothetical protein
VTSSFAFGAQSVPCTCALREMRTLPLVFVKILMSQALSSPLSGRTWLPLSNFTDVMTLMVTGPDASSAALRPSRRLQKVYEPGARISVPGPRPPPATSTLL